MNTKQKTRYHEARKSGETAIGAYIWAKGGNLFGSHFQYRTRNGKTLFSFPLASQMVIIRFNSETSYSDLVELFN